MKSFDTMYGKIVLLFLQFTFLLLIIVNVTPLRQIFVLTYITLIPGAILLYFLCSSNKLSIEAKMFLSVGLSIAFLMHSGLLVNEIGLVLGIFGFLSLVPILFVLNIFLILFSHFLNLKNNEKLVIRLKVSNFPCLIPLLCFLVFMSMIGAIFFNNEVGHFIFLFAFFAISILIGISVVSSDLIPQKMYFVILLSICLTFILQYFLLTPYLLGGGGDIFSEYYVFKLTQIGNYWNPFLKLSNFEAMKANNMLSVTVLPQIYSTLLNLDGAFVFKFVVPSIVSIALSVGLFVLYETQVNKETAFLATFFFIANSVILGWGPAKQLIGEFFYILLIFVFLSKEVPARSKNILMIIFGFCLIVSHYSLSYIFLGTILLIVFISFVLKKRIEISLITAIFLLVLAFTWYIYTSGSAPFAALLNTANHVYQSFLSDFFNPRSRGESVLRGIGATQAVSTLHYIGRIFFYITEFFIILGFVKLVASKSENFSRDYKTFALINFGALILNILIPGLAGSFLMERWYIVLLIILSPLCIVGGEAFFRSLFKYILKLKFIDKKNIMLSLCSVLILFFIFNSGFVYEIAHDESWSLPLSMYRMNDIRLHELIIEKGEVDGAIWLTNFVNLSSVIIYADTTSMFHILEPYGLIDSAHLKPLYNSTTISDAESFVYLRYTNIKHALAYTYLFSWNISDIRSIISCQNMVYSNGDCYIFRGTDKR